MAGIYDSPEMMRAFLDEIEEQLQLLEQSILELEQNGDTSEAIQEIFRAAHTLKGSSAAMGFEKMKQLTHEMENVLDKVRSHQLKTTKSVINILFQCLDHLRVLKEDFAADKNDIKTDITSTLRGLKEILLSTYNEKELNKEVEIYNKWSEFTLNSENKAEIKEAVQSGLNSLICDVDISKESPMKYVRAYLMLKYFSEMGNVIATEPDLSKLADNAEVSKVLYLIVTELTAETIKSRALSELTDLENVEVKPYVSEVEQHQSIMVENEKKIFDEKKSVGNEKKISQTVRVDVEKLEKMMNFIGELVIEQTRIAQVGTVLYSRYTSDNTVEDLLGISNHVSRVISELQETVMKTRMLPIQQLFNRFPRMVRDLSEALNKEIELVIEGGDTEMDRTIIEDITDPMIHLIRNAVDHGIETPDKRLKAGKNSKGTIRITAFHEENHVILNIEDDGAGIDFEKLKEAAVKKQIISKEKAEAITEHEAINLIFHTGFSTANAVSDISGRGVGMDIVRNHIDKLNGIIDVETKKGEGTKFTIKLPLTLAILTGLLVKINKETYALPMSNVVEIVRKPESEIKSVKGQTVAVIRERVLPLVWLHDYFGISRIKRKKNVFIVVIGIAEKRIGLVVDELIGNQEIVVKPLGAYIGKVEGFSGATILGDGSLACILDVVGVARMVSSKDISKIDY